MIFTSCVKFEPDAPAPVESNSTGPKNEAQLNKSVSKILQSVSSVDVRSGFKISFQKNSSDISKVELKFLDAINPVLVLSGEEVDAHDNAYIFAPSSDSRELEVKRFFNNNTARSTKIILKKNEINFIRI